MSRRRPGRKIQNTTAKLKAVSPRYWRSYLTDEKQPENRASAPLSNRIDMGVDENYTPPVYAEFEPSMFLSGLACGVVFAAIVWLLFAHVSISWR